MAPPAAAVTADDCPQEWTSGVDWFRYRVDGPGVVREAWQMAVEIQDDDRMEGERVRPWRWQGYEGKRSPRIRWGMKGHTLFWETSGAWAEYTWRRMPLSGGRATRIDLHSTVRLSQPRRDFGMRCLGRAATTHPYRLPSGTPVGLQRGADGMWLGTVGRRTCPEYFRVYDKGVETRDFNAGHLWRLELEVKYAHAEALCREHSRDLMSPKWVASYATSRWRSFGLRWPLRSDEEQLAGVRRAARPEPTTEARMEWLRHTVRPVVCGLTMTTDVSAILEALGLNGVAVPREPDEGAGGGAEGHPAG